MAKKYYCDYCECSFPDNDTNRKKHNAGAVHQANKRRHFDWFKDPHEFIAQQMSKPPCRRFLSQGYCEYELDCKFNHIKHDYAGQPIFPPELVHWLQSRHQYDHQQLARRLAQQKCNEAAAARQPRHRLPRGWKVRELPPSLKPPPSKHGYDWFNTGFWG